ncbi:META domain-containing protein [Vibrio olivae]|uniref:META domain-containing protein n=1 Tax=Vibrio olivae TaxID=1243002 RepID=A0ABV5HK55_9VIBR
MKLSSKALLTTITLPLLVVGCSQMKSNDNSDAITAADLQNHRWELVNVNGQDFKPANPKQRPFLEISEGFRASGSAGCNNFIGQAELNDNQFRIDKMGMTMKMCIGDVMDFEQAISQALQNWSDVTLTADTLTLKTDVNQLTYKLSELK